LRGLLLLLDFVIRNQAANGFCLPADLAHGYVSAIRRLKLSHTVREPLAVLCHVGILRRVRRATNSWHLKLPAAYALSEAYVKRRLKLDVGLPPYLSRKRLSALDRREERLNGRYPFRERGAPRIGRQSPRLLQAGSRGVPKEKPLPQKTLPPSKGINSVRAEIDTGPPKSRKAPPESVTLGRGRSPDAFRTNQLLAQLKPSSKCFRCQLPAFPRREFIAMLAQEFGDCLSATIAPTGCLKTFGSCTMDRAKHRSSHCRRVRITLKGGGLCAEY
jgi:hypothetical protein